MDFQFHPLEIGNRARPSELSEACGIDGRERRFLVWQTTMVAKPEHLDVESCVIAVSAGGVCDYGVLCYEVSKDDDTDF